VIAQRVGNRHARETGCLGQGAKSGLGHLRKVSVPLRPASR
jgi:hypothetical protein